MKLTGCHFDCCRVVKLTACHFDRCRVVNWSTGCHFLFAVKPRGNESRQLPIFSFEWKGRRRVLVTWKLLGISAAVPSQPPPFVCCCFYRLLVIGCDYQLMSHNDKHPVNISTCIAYEEKKKNLDETSISSSASYRKQTASREQSLYIVVVHLLWLHIYFNTACAFAYLFIVTLHAREKCVTGRTW